MSRPLNELKRRLEDESTPLPKRFRLAKNVAFSDHFPTTPKERVIGEWLEELTSNKKITNKDLRDVLSWLDSVDDFTVELKYKLIKIVVQYLNKNIIQDDDIEYITAFMENVKILPQLNIQIEDYLSITMSLLQHLTNSTNILLVDKILNHITKYYKECRKKFEFTIKLLDEENLETIFGFLNTKNETSMLNLCQIVLFPINKRSLFARYLNNFIRKDNANNLSEGRNDNMESVVKVMDAFFTNEHTKNEKFLSDFIKVFVSCFRNESQLLFAFYITVVNCLNMNQTYLTTVTKLTPITFEENDEKIKRNIFYNMLEVLLQNEVDVSVHLRDTLNEKSKETKKVFLLFLQDVMTGTLKMEGKPDKISLNIIQIALKLDPSLIDQKMLQILPPIMISKKGSSISETYSETVNILLQTLFKLSKGIDFIHQMLPHLKNCLEKCDTKQEDLKEKLNQSVDDECSDKIWSKIVNGYDILPQNCVEMYGKLTSELMFRQNKDLLLLLQKDLEGCLDDLEDGNCRPSLVTLIEMLSAILSSFLRHNKMADHTVPLPISEDFWTIYQSFEDQCLKKFGECVIKTDCNPILTSFLKLCLCFAQLKVLNIKYSNTKLVFPEFQHATDVFDIHSLLPCLSETQWKEIARKVNEENAILLDELLLVKTMAQNLLNIKSYRKDIDESISNTKSHLIKHLSSTILLIDHDYLAQVLLTNLDKDQLRQSAKCLIKMYVNSGDMDIFKRDSVVNNKMLLNALVFEVAKNVTKKIENASSLSKNLGKNSFEITSFFKDIDVKEYYSNLTISSENFEDIVTYIEVLKHLQLYYLDENCQLTAIFVLMTLKKCCNSKKTKRSIDYVLQSIFEISPRNPDLFKLFPVNFIFNFESGILELLKLNAKTSNHVSIIKNILETAVKKVKEEPEVVTNMVELLLNNYRKKNIHITSISHFNDEVFQIICIVLPLIAKEKKNITKSAYRSILANLQENLHEAMLDSFKSVNFGESLLNASNTDDSMISENTMATLNAMGAYTLTLSKVCEVGTEIKSMDCLWSGLEFFVQNAIQSIENSETKSLHVDLSMQLLNVILRYIKRLDTHEIFQNRDKLFLQIWRALKSRLFVVLDHRQKRNIVCLDQIAITLKFLAELSSIEFFSNSIIADLNMLYILKKPSILLKNDELKTSQIISRNVLKYLTLNILKANIIEAKCTTLEKLIFRSTKNIRFWIQQHYSNGTGNQNGVAKMNVTVEDPICELLKIDLDILADVILAGRKIPLDYKFIDAIFELQQLVHYILGRNTIDARCEVTWQSFFTLFEGSVTILNSMILSRQELLEDRWPCLMQCYKTLVLCMCERSTSQNDLDRVIEHKFSEIAHSIEKLTQSISKRKAHVSRIAAYAVGDFCSWLEKSPPPKIVRQHLENSIVLLIQASDSNYAMAFLRRGLAGSIGQMTLTNMYTMYKRYHKYVGNT